MSGRPEGPSIDGTRPAGAPRKVLVIDDHPLVRIGISQLIEREQDLVVVGEAGDASEALSAMRQDTPHLATLDINLPGVNGIELLKQIQSQWPEVKVLVTSMYEEELYAERALEAGARGYIEKRRAIREIVTAIRKVLEGGVYLSSEMTDRMLERKARRPANDGGSQDEIQVLSDRELEVFALLGQGLTTRQIAERLHLSPKTIESHRENIKAKLDLANANELVRRAVEWVLTQG